MAAPVATNALDVFQISATNPGNSSETYFNLSSIFPSREPVTVPVINHLDSVAAGGNINANFTMKNISAPFLLVLLSNLARSQTLKYHTTPAHAYSLSFTDAPHFGAYPLSPQYLTTPAYATTPTYPEFYGSSTPSYNPIYTQAVVPSGHGSTPPPVYHGRVPSFCDPHHPPACAKNGSYYCIHDSKYPTYDVENALKEDRQLAEKYADVSDQSADDLVTHIAEGQEARFDYSYYNPSAYDITHWIGPEGYLCPSEVIYGTPKRAKNVKGEWRVIVNGVRYYSQTTRLEICKFPLTPCRMLAPCYKSKCVQKFVYHRMLSYDPCDPYKGLFVDIYRMPSACSCFVPEMVE